MQRLGAMTRITNPKIALLAIASIACGGALGYGLLTTHLKRTIEVYTCNKDVKTRNSEIELIVQSGPEYVIVNPSNTWSKNSFVVSNQIPNTAYNWKLRGLNTDKAQWSGFKLVANGTEKQPVVEEITFEANSKLLSIKYGKRKDNGYKPDDIKVTCRIKGNYTELVKQANNFPMEYLKERTSGIPLTMPNLDNKTFNESLLKAMQGRDNSVYTQYQLLNRRRKSSLSAQETDKLEDLRKQLIDKNTSRRSVWEFSGTYRWWYQAQYPNEEAEAGENAREWCEGNQYSTRANYTNKGYKVISSDYERRGSRNWNWTRKNYPDGRFGGYVKYKAECDGTNYQLEKKGTVDNRNVNNYS